MYNIHGKKYIPEKTPYYPINPRFNMSELNLERLNYKTELPKILNSDYRVVK
jgi:hypothetical protein